MYTLGVPQEILAYACLAIPNPSESESNGDSTAGDCRHLRPDEPVQVVLRTTEDDEDADWQRFAAEQFLKGYAPGDEMYDHLPAS